ncbi:hypothetical protein D3C87_84900 [compost metagenome]
MKKIIHLALGLGLSMNASAQLQNLDFEVCDTSTVQRIPGYNCFYLEGWKRTNGTPVNTVTSYSIDNGGVTDTQNGDMALKLSVFYTHDKDMAYQRAAYTSFPASLKGYYKYFDNLIYNHQTQNVERDTATVSVLLSKWNSHLNQRDTIGFGQLKLSEAFNYTPFSCPVHYTSTVTPDSILIHLNCSRIRDEYGLSGNLFGDNSFFFIDNLSLEDGTLGLEEPAESKKWQIFPNPGNGLIHIPEFTGEATLVDVHGKHLVSQSYPESAIDLNSFPQGVYLLRLKEHSGRITFISYLNQ